MIYVFVTPYVIERRCLKAPDTLTFLSTHKNDVPDPLLALDCSDCLCMDCYIDTTYAWFHALSSTEVPSWSDWRSLYREYTPHPQALSVALLHGAKEEIRSVLPRTSPIVSIFIAPNKIISVGDLVFIPAMAQKILLLNSYSVANELLSKRGSLYSGRYSFPLVQEM